MDNETYQHLEVIVEDSLQFNVSAELTLFISSCDYTDDIMSRSLNTAIQHTIEFTIPGVYGVCGLFSFFWLQIDLGTGNNNKVNWAMTDKQEFIDICEVVFRGARKGRGLVVSPKDYSTKYRY